MSAVSMMLAGYLPPQTANDYWTVAYLALVIVAVLLVLLKDHNDD